MKTLQIELASGLPGHLVEPEGSASAPAVLVFMEAYGVNEYVRSECRRLAELGYVALAPDFYRGDTFSYDDTDRMMPRLLGLSDEALLADVRASLEYLDRFPRARHEHYGAVGFCMGGRLAFLAAATFGTKIGAAVAFYGGHIAPDEARMGRKILVDRVCDVKAPLLFLYGAEDPSIEPSEHANLARALSAAKKSYTITVYPGAGHAFASRDRPSYRPAVAEQAWTQAAAFFKTNLRPPQ
jgi:carboxymethylenebutenolidase